MSESTQVTVTVTTGGQAGTAATAGAGTGRAEGPVPVPLDQLSAQAGGGSAATDGTGSVPVPDLGAQTSGAGQDGPPTPGEYAVGAPDTDAAGGGLPVPTDLDNLPDEAEETEAGSGEGTARKRQSKRPAPTDG